jgi:hypothetical protein
MIDRNARRRLLSNGPGAERMAARLGMKPQGRVPAREDSISDRIIMSIPRSDGSLAMGVELTDCDLGIAASTAAEDPIIVLILSDQYISVAPMFRLAPDAARELAASLVELATKVEADAMAQANAALRRANGGGPPRRPSDGNGQGETR